MKTTASAALTSAENTAANAMADERRQPRMKIIGARGFGVDTSSGEAAARHDAEQRRHASEQSARPSALSRRRCAGAVVFRTEDLLQQTGETTNAGASSSTSFTASAPANVQYCTSSARTAKTAGQPPNHDCHYSATAKPKASYAASCTTFTQADVSRPPAAK